MDAPKTLSYTGELRINPQGKTAADGESERVVSVIVSTESKDRAGDIIRQDGVNLSPYRINPVVLFQHDHGQPIASARNIQTDGQSITADAVFPEAGTIPEADKVYNLIKAGIIRAVSIGLAVKEWAWIGDYEGIDFIKTEMIEFSFVSVPANPEAMIVAASAEKELSRTLAAVEARLARLERSNYLLNRKLKP